MLIVFQVFGCAISPNGTLLATGGNDNALCITNIATEAKLYSVECDNWVRARRIFIALTIIIR